MKIEDVCALCKQAADDTSGVFRLCGPCFDKFQHETGPWTLTETNGTAIRIGDHILPEQELNRRLRTTHACMNCGGRRYFSSRLRDDGLCGPCFYGPGNGTSALEMGGGR